MAAPWERNWSAPKEEAAPWERKWAEPEKPAEPEGSDFVRGFTGYLPQLRETLGATQVLAGKALDSEEMMKAGLERMKAAKAELSAKYKETDSFMSALDKGVGSVLTDWLPYQMGSGAANLVESLAVMGAGMTLGSTVPGVGTAAGGVTGLLEKELLKKGVKEAAEKIAKELGEDAAQKFFEEKTKEAAKAVAKKVAGTTALAAQAGFHGAGETTSRAIEEAERLGKDAKDIDMGRVLPASIIHATAEFVGDKIGLGALSNLDPASKSLLINFAKNLLVTGTKEAPVEVIQTMAERFGAHLSLSDAEAVKEYIDSAAAAYAMSVVPSGGGAVRQTGEAKLQADLKKREELARQEEESRSALEEQAAKAQETTQAAEEQAAKITETAAPAEGEVTIPTFTPLVTGEETSAEQPTGTIAGPSEPSAESTARGVGAPTGESVTPDAAGVEPVGRAAEPSVERAGVQPAALEEAVPLTPEIEVAAKQLYEQYAAQQIEAGVPSVVPWESLGEATKQEFYNQVAGTEVQVAEPTTVEPAVTEPAEAVGEVVAPAAEEPTAQPVTEVVSAAPTEVVKEPAATEATKPVEKKDYAATERVFSKEQMPFVTAKVQDRASIPRTVDEAASFAAAESAYDMFDSAEKAVNKQLDEQAQEQGLTRDEVMAAMPEQQLFQMYYDNANANNLDSARRSQAQAREAFIKTLPENDQKAVREKAISSLHKEIKAKREGKATTESDKRKARQKTYDEAAAKRAKRAEKKATAEVKETEKQIKKLETTKKEKTPVEIREERVKEALKSGSGFQVASAIASGYNPDKSRTIDNISQAFAQRLAKLMSAFDHEPEIVVGKVEGNRPGKYDPETETITIDPNAPRDVPLEAVILHELTHYAVDRMIDNQSKLTTEQKENIRDLEKLHKYVHSFLGDKYQIPTLKEFAAEAFSNTKFQREMAVMPPMRNKSVLNMFAERIMKLLGFRSGEVGALGETLTSIDQLIFGPRRGDAKEVSYAPKPAGTAKDRSFADMVDDMKSDKPTPLRTRAKDLVATGKGRDTLVRKFQNDRVAIKRWQDRLMAQGRIISYGLGFNNIYDQITLSAGNANWAFTHHAQNTVQDVRDNVTEYAKEYNLSTDEALKELGLFAIAKHYEERRRVLYAKTVPLSDAKILRDGNGVAVSPEEARAEVFKLLDTAKLTDAQIKQLRDGLDSLVFAPNNKYLSKDKKDADKLDIASTKYDVAGAYSDSEIATILREYNARKSVADKVLDKVKRLNEINKSLNKEANYLSKYADNWIKFYGWENYIPLKGKALSEEAEMLNLDSQRLGGELQEAVYTFEGRVTPPDNPILQVMSDSALAALRVGRKDVTEAIYNAVKDKTLKGSIKELSFYDRNNVKELAEYKGESKVFHYMPDGKVAVIKLDDVAQREAIRRTYKETNPLVDRLNKVTSTLGQLHTRYNVAFAPVNFVRDVLTNAYTLGSELGPKETFRYLGAIATGIVREQYKAAKFSYHYANGNTARINELAAKDPYYRDLMEYVKTGGKVSYIAGIAPKGQYEELMKSTGGGKIASTKAQVNKFFDMWIDSFELTARVGAYRLAKSNEKAEQLRAGKSESEAENSARIKGAAYAKNLANFEQIGEWGKTLGAWFMFFRPSATGAVRAMEAVAPAFMDVRQAKLRLPEYAELLNLRHKLKTEKVEGAQKEKLEKRVAELGKAIDKFESTYSERKKNAQVMATALIGAGVITYLMSRTMADDDDLGRNKVSTDDMSRWTRFARFFIPGSDTIVQMPWGFGLGAFAAMGAQMASAFDTNTDFSDTLANMAVIGMDSFMPLPISRIPITEKPLEFALDTMAPSIVRPLIEYIFNTDALGRQIYNNRQTRYGDAYTGGDNIPEAYKDAARYWFDITGNDVSPNTLYFFANNYADGASRLMVQNPYNMGLWLLGEKEFNAKTDLMVLDSFIGTKSNFDARQWSKIEDDLKERQKIVNMLKENKPVQYAEYLAAHPLDQMLVDMYEKDVNGELRDLRAQANQFRAMDGLSPKDRKAIIDSIVMQQNLVKYQLVQLYKSLGVNP